MFPLGHIQLTPSLLDRGMLVGAGPLAGEVLEGGLAPNTSGLTIQCLFSLKLGWQFVSDVPAL